MYTKGATQFILICFWGIKESDWTHLVKKKLDPELKQITSETKQTHTKYFRFVRLGSKGFFLFYF